MVIDDDEKLYMAFKAILGHNDIYLDALDIMILVKCLCKRWRRLVYALLIDTDLMIQKYDGGPFDCMKWDLSRSDLTLPVKCVILPFPSYELDHRWEEAYPGLYKLPVFTITEYCTRVDRDFLINADQDTSDYWYTQYDQYVNNIKLRLDSTGEEFTSISGAMNRSTTVIGDNSIIELDEEVHYHQAAHDLHLYVVVVVPCSRPDCPWYKVTSLALLVEHSVDLYKNKHCILNFGEGDYTIEENIPTVRFTPSVSEGRRQFKQGGGALFDVSGIPCVDVRCC